MFKKRIFPQKAVASFNSDKSGSTLDEVLQNVLQEKLFCASISDDRATIIRELESINFKAIKLPNMNIHLSSNPTIADYFELYDSFNFLLLVIKQDNRIKSSNQQIIDNLINILVDSKSQHAQNSLQQSNNSINIRSDKYYKSGSDITDSMN